MQETRFSIIFNVRIIESKGPDASNSLVQFQEMGEAKTRRNGTPVPASHL